jgi:hypothetical protein
MGKFHGYTFLRHRLPREYTVYRETVRRCTDPKCRDYPSYGGRGVRVPESWIGPKGYEAFIRDVGYSPTPQHELHRRDRSLPYSAENCVWGTARDRILRWRKPRMVTAFGRTQSLRDWSLETGISASNISQRIRIHGMSPEEAVTRPVRKKIVRDIPPPPTS